MHVGGRWIKDDLGNTIVLRGVSKAGFDDEPTGWWSPYGGGWYDGLGIWNPDTVKTNLDCMKSWGCNYFTLVDCVEWWHYNTNNYRQKIKDIITWAGERGLYVLLAPHMMHYVEGVDVGRAYIPYPPYRIDPPIPSARLPEYEAVLPNETAFINYKIEMANELKGFSNVLMYMWAEPCANWKGNTTVINHYWDTAQQTINGMRATGFTGIVLMSLGYDTSLWSDVSWAIDCPIVDGNIAYAAEIYCHDSWCPASSIPWYNEWFTYSRLKTNMEAARIREALETYNLPLICSETGCNVWWKDPSYPTYEWDREFECFQNLLTIFNEWKIGCNLWWWKQGGAYDIFAGDYYTFEPNEVGQAFIDALVGITKLAITVTAKKYPSEEPIIGVPLQIRRLP